MSQHPTIRPHRVAIGLALGICLTLLNPSGAVHAGTVLQSGGVTLDGFGGLHAFGGASVDTSNAPYWRNWDIARGAAVREDGSGGWTLDGFGGIHNWGSAPPISTPAYWTGWDIARDIVTYSKDSSGVSNGASGYLLDAYGGVHAWGAAPGLTSSFYSRGADVARSLLLHFDGQGNPDGGWVLTVDGSMQAFGAAMGQAAPLTLTKEDVWQKLRAGNGGTYAVGKWGLTTLSASMRPNWTGYSDWGTWDILRDIALLPVQAGSASAQPVSPAVTTLYAAIASPHPQVILDGYGGLHQFGDTAINLSGSPYWTGWDIARSVVVRDDGSGGWTLDGYGAIHEWGSAPAVTSPVSWQGWDIARAMAMTSKTSGVTDGDQGYILDGWGGVHAWGGAPNIGAPPFKQGFDIYRGLAIHYDGSANPDGGWAMTDGGQTYAFGNAPPLGTVLPGLLPPIFRAFHATPYGQYAVARDGAITTVGSGFVGPYWNGWVDWGSWGIVRDIVVVNPVNPQESSVVGFVPQPLSAAAMADYHSTVNNRYVLPAPIFRQSHSLDCEAASMQIALAARGTSISQDWALAYWGADLRPAARDGAGNIVGWGDPFQTFVGNVNASEWNATGYGIYYPPLVSLANATGHGALGQQNWDPQQLMELVASGYPAAIEISFNMQLAGPRAWTAWDGRTVPYILNDHVVTMIGVDYGRQTIIVNDPYDARQKEFSWGDFYRAFSYLGNMATVIS